MHTPTIEDGVKIFTNGSFVLAREQMGKHTCGIPTSPGSMYTK